MSTTGVLVSGRHRRRRSAAPLVRFVSVASDPQSYRNLLYLALALPLGVAYVTVIAVGLATGQSQADIAKSTGLALNSVITYRRRAYQKLKVADRLELRAMYDQVTGPEEI